MHSREGGSQRGGGLGVVLQILRPPPSPPRVGSGGPKTKRLCTLSVSGASTGLWAVTVGYKCR